MGGSLNFSISLQIAKFAQLILRKYKQLEERLGRIYRRYKHPDNKGKKGGTASGNYYEDDEPIYDEIPEQRSITSLPRSAIGSNRSSELGMEYDDIETILLGKLSAKDLAGVVDIEPEGEEKFNPLQLEVEADIEPVKEQPLYANIQAEVESDTEPVKEQPLYANIQAEVEADMEQPLYADIEAEVEADIEPVKEQPLYENIQADKKSSPYSKVKKRKKSTHKHHSKPEPTHHHSHHNRHKKHHTTEEGGEQHRGRERGHKVRLSPSQLRIHDEQFRQMGVALPDRPLPPPPSFPPPPPPPPPYASPQRAPPNAPSLIDFTDMPLPDWDSPPAPSKQ